MNHRAKTILKHGGKPPYPLYYYNGVVRKESACGGQSLCEHAPSDRMDSGGACEADRLHYSVNRIRNSAKHNCFCREGRNVEYFTESLYPNERNVESVNTTRTATPD